MRSHCITCYVNGNNSTYFSSFGIKHIPRHVKEFIRHKSIITSVHRIKPYDAIMCGYFFIEFIDFMLKRKILLDYTNWLSPNKYEKNDKIKLKRSCIICGKYREVKKHKTS